VAYCFDQMKLERCFVFQISYTVHTQKKLMWQVGDVLIEAGSLIQAGGTTAFVLIEAGGLY